MGDRRSGGGKKLLSLEMAGEQVDLLWCYTQKKLSILFVNAKIALELQIFNITANAV